MYKDSRIKQTITQQIVLSIESKTGCRACLFLKLSDPHERIHLFPSPCTMTSKCITRGRMKLDCGREQMTYCSRCREKGKSDEKADWMAQYIIGHIQLAICFRPVRKEHTSGPGRSWLMNFEQTSGRHGQNNGNDKRKKQEDIGLFFVGNHPHHCTPCSQYSGYAANCNAQHSYGIALGQDA